MKRECTRRAQRKYEREKVNSISVRFYPKDIDLYLYFKSIPDGNKQEYIRSLIRKDMEERKVGQ